MRIRPLAICILLFACSCRLVVDPDRFRDQDANNGGSDGRLPDALPDAPLVDATPLNCTLTQPRYLDPQGLLRQGRLDLSTDTYRIVHRDNTWQLVDSAENVEAVLYSVQQGTPPGEALVLAVEGLSLPVGAVIEARGTQTTPPLIVVAESEINIEGTLDISSEGSAILGMGANPSTCTGQGENGEVDGSSIGSGGGGGGFGKPGAQGGGTNQLPTGGNGGSAISGGTPDTIRGGCAGGNGASAGSTPNGLGGNGGGAVHLIACSAIVVSGIIYAGGGGGSGGSGASGLAEGGGGGGSGGYIGLEAPAVALAGASVLAANGAGGGGASRNDNSGQGARGDDGSIDANPALGGANSDSSGNGGAGGALNGDAVSGTDGSGFEAGAGAGGGVGVIYIRSGFANPDDALVVSPAAQQDTP